MAKSTNHTAHNQSYKNHRNGIKKPDQLRKGQRRTLRGVSGHARRAARCRASCSARRLAPPFAAPAFTMMGELSAPLLLLLLLPFPPLVPAAHPTDNTLRPLSSAPCLADGPEIPAQPSLREEVERQGP